MIRILALILRSQWVPEGSDRKDHRDEGEVRAVLEWGEGSRCKGPEAVCTSYVRGHHQVEEPVQPLEHL